jgi:hypothetical protein
MLGGATGYAPKRLALRSLPESKRRGEVWLPSSILHPLRGIIRTWRSTPTLRSQGFENENDDEDEYEAPCNKYAVGKGRTVSHVPGPTFAIYSVCIVTSCVPPEFVGTWISSPRFVMTIWNAAGELFSRTDLILVLTGKVYPMVKLQPAGAVTVVT